MIMLGERNAEHGKREHWQLKVNEREHYGKEQEGQPLTFFPLSSFFEHSPNHILLPLLTLFFKTRGRLLGAELGTGGRAGKQHG